MKAVMNLKFIKICLDQVNNYQLLTHDPPPYICKHNYKHDLYFEIVYYITDFMISKAQPLDTLQMIQSISFARINHILFCGTLSIPSCSSSYKSSKISRCSLAARWLYL